MRGNELNNTRRDRLTQLFETQLARFASRKDQLDETMAQQSMAVALLLACVEYDTSRRQAADTTRQAALSLGIEADHAEITGWAHEIRAWINLTSGEYNGVIAAARAGTDAAPVDGVRVQLAAQEAKASARIGDRRLVEVALDRGHRLMEAMPYPENVDHHFVVDPTKFDFYAMDATGSSPRTTSRRPWPPR